MAVNLKKKKRKYNGRKDPIQNSNKNVFLQINLKRNIIPTKRK